jgi:cullin 4
MGTNKFCDEIFNDERLKDKIIDGACDLVAADRKGGDLDQAVFRQAISMFHELATYTKVFEPHFLKKSQKFISSWAEQATSEMRVAEYVDSCVKFMAKEKERCDLYSLDNTTRRGLVSLLEYHLIERRQAFLGKILLSTSQVVYILDSLS